MAGILEDVKASPDLVSKLFCSPKFGVAPSEYVFPFEE
jgi:hypothetical protein